MLSDFKVFLSAFCKYLVAHTLANFLRLEKYKGFVVVALYKQRGRLVHRFIHSGMAGITAFGVMIAPVVAQEFPGSGNTNPWEIPSPSSVLSASDQDPEIATSLANEGIREKVIEYTVGDGDTVSSIAQKFGISVDTIRWQNNLASKDAIKVGQHLEILPVEGVSHKVQKGDTVESIAKKYDAEPQAIVNFPFNTFENDETFKLAIGQTVIVPDGVKPEDVIKPVAPRTRQTTPNAGTVVASGSFVWPTSGTITQRYAWYHKALDIANRAAPTVLAADSGKIITAGWSSVGYGNHIIIDHGNGFKTLYAHLSKFFVNEGQTVNRGSAIGQMGSTGRSTGIHLHFEVIQNGVHLNPLSVLR